MAPCKSSKDDLESLVRAKNQHLDSGLDWVNNFASILHKKNTKTNINQEQIKEHLKRHYSSEYHNQEGKANLEKKSDTIQHLLQLFYLLMAEYIISSKINCSPTIFPAWAVKINEGLTGCTAGFYDRLLELAATLNRPKNFAERIALYREELVKQAAVIFAESDDIHEYNFISNVAAHSRYGVKAINEHDPYSGVDDKTAAESDINASLSCVFERRFTPMQIINAIESQIRDELLALGYQGIVQQGYIAGTYEKLSNYFNVTFNSPQIECSNDHFMQWFVCDAQSQAIYDVNWNYIRASIFKGLQQEGLFKRVRWDKKDIEQFNIIDVALYVEHYAAINSINARWLKSRIQSAYDINHLLTYAPSFRVELYQLLKNDYPQYISNGASLAAVVNQLPLEQRNEVYLQLESQPETVTLIDSVDDLLATTNRLSNELATEVLRFTQLDLTAPTDEQQNTLAHLAASRGLIKVLQLLKQQGLNLNSPNACKATPAHYAAQYGQTEVLRFFKQMDSTLLKARDNCGATLSHYAAEHDQIDVLECLIELDENLIESDDKGFTPIHRAAIVGNVNVLAFFLDKNYECAPTLNDLFTLAHIAAQYGHVELMQFLLIRKSKLDVIDKHGATPAHYAAAHGNINILRLLNDKGYALDTSDIYGATPAHYAAQNNQVAVVRFLKDTRFAATLMQENKEGNTLAHYVAESGCTEIMEVLDDARCSLASTNKKGMTPAHVAANSGRVNILLQLLRIKAYAHTLSTIDLNGCLPSHYAAQQGHITILQILNETEFKMTLRARDCQGNSLAHYAAQNNQVAVLVFLKEQGHKLIANDSGDFPFHAAVASNQLDVIQYFLQLPDLDVNKKNSKGLTALMLAASYAHEAAVTLLLKCPSIDLQQKDSKNQTALDHAKGNLAIKSSLLRAIQQRQNTSNKPTPIFFNNSQKRPLAPAEEPAEIKELNELDGANHKGRPRRNSRVPAQDPSEIEEYNELKGANHTPRPRRP